ncbi:hypothetical protein GCM10029992_05600 [Glycomyces albus]
MATEEKARPAAGAFDRFFHLSENRTTWKREILAGTTTFLAMAYILAVNPIILGDAGMPAGGVFAATAVAAATGCLVMGLWARYPIAQAPGMGLNAFFAYTVVLTMGIDWQVALAGTFISGALFFVLAVTGVREMIVNAIPTQMKLATGAGIGLFIAFIGFQKAGIVADDPATLVTLGDFRSGPTLLALFGLVATVVFLVLGWKGAVFYGLIATTALGVATGVTAEAADLTPDFASTFGQGITHLPEAFTGQMIVVILTMLFVDFFDTSGTLFAVAGQAGMLKDGKLPRAGRAMASDSIATMAGAVFGTSTTTSYIESSSGVAVGGRTGLTAVTTGAWFLPRGLPRGRHRRRHRRDHRPGPDRGRRAHGQAALRHRMGPARVRRAGVPDSHRDAADLFDRQRHRPGPGVLSPGHDHQGALAGGPPDHVRAAAGLRRLLLLPPLAAEAGPAPTAPARFVHLLDRAGRAGFANRGRGAARTRRRCPHRPACAASPARPGPAARARTRASAPRSGTGSAGRRRRPGCTG